jgi:WD40 repeat protein/putative methionine-R-sulfoxide reductase with GAF domain
VAAFWNGDEMARVLGDWSRRAPVAIMQLFSERSWPHTTLGPPSRQVRALFPGIVNAKLDIERKRWERRKADGSLIAIPIFSLEPESIARWAQTAMGMGVKGAPAIIFTSEGRGVDAEPEYPEAKQLDPRTRVERFRMVASAEAFRLACYLAAVPLTLPIMRIVQQQVCPAPRVEHLAEVMASGLLERLTPASAIVDPDMVVYTFLDEVGDLLLDAIPLGPVLDVRAEVQTKLKDFIERQIGRSIDNFRAFVLDEHGKYTLPLDAQAFVEIERSLLRKLGFWPHGWTLEQVRLFLDQPDNLRRIAWSGDAKLLASGGFDKLVRIWDVQSGMQARSLRGHADVVYAVCWSPDARMLASGSADGTIRIWARESGRAVRVLDCHDDKVLGLAWSPDGQIIACGANSGSVTFWDATTGRQQPNVHHHQGAVHTVAWSPDGTLLASASNDRTVNILSLQRDRQPSVLTGHEGQVYGITWSGDSSTLASSGADGTIRLWNRAGSEVAKLRGHVKAVTDLSFAADGLFLASISWDNTVRVWDIRDHREIAMLPVKSARRFHTGIAFHPLTGHSVAVVTEGASAIEIWQPTGEQVFQPGQDNATRRLLDSLGSIGLNRDRALEVVNEGPGALAEEILKLAPSQNTAFQNCLRIIQEFAQSGWNQLLLLHAGKLVVVAEEIEPNKKRYRYGASAANWTGIIGRAAKTQAVVWVPDVDRDAGYIAAVPSTAAELAVPLLSTDGSFLLGVVNVELTKAHALSESQRHWLIQFCEPLARRIESRSRNVYIGCATRDEPVASKLASDLKEAGFSAWLALEQLRAGENVVETIEAAIQNSGSFVVLMSGNVTSTWLRHEIELARAHQSAIQIITVMIEGPTHSYLSEFNFIDLRVNYQSGLQALLRALTGQVHEAEPGSSEDSESAELLRREWHPSKDLENRGPLNACTFSFEPDYQKHGANRWKKWADVLVVLDEDFPHEDYPYLLPSRKAPVRFQDPQHLLDKDKLALEQKRELTSDFVSINLGAKLRGLWFYKVMKNGSRAIQVYSQEYDDFLKPDVTNLTIQNLGHYWQLLWEWPTMASGARICWQPDHFARTPRDHGVRSRQVSKGEYDQEGGIRIEFPLGNYYVVVFGSYGLDDDEIFSSGSSAGCRGEITVVRRSSVRYTIRRGRFPNFTPRLAITCDQPTELPRMLLVARPGNVQPIDAKDGNRVLEIPPRSISKTLELELRAENLPKPCCCRLFFSELSSYNLFQLIDPPVDSRSL